MIGGRFPDGSPYSRKRWVNPIFFCCSDKVGIGESNPGGHERQSEAPVKLRTGSGPQATGKGAKEAACERSEVIRSRRSIPDGSPRRSGLRCCQKSARSRFFRALHRLLFPPESLHFPGPNDFFHAARKANGQNPKYLSVLSVFSCKIRIFKAIFLLFIPLCAICPLLRRNCPLFCAIARTNLQFLSHSVRMPLFTDNRLM